MGLVMENFQMKTILLLQPVSIRKYYSALGYFSGQESPSRSNGVISLKRSGGLNLIVPLDL